MTKEGVINIIKTEPARQKAYEEKTKRAEEEEKRKREEEVAAEYRRNNQLLSRSGAKEIFQAINKEFLGGKGNISQRDYAVESEVREEYMQGTRDAGYIYSHYSGVSLKWTIVRKNGPRKKVENRISVVAEHGDTLDVTSSLDQHEHSIYFQGKISRNELTDAQLIAWDLTGIQFKSLRSATEEVVARVFGQIMSQ